MLRARGLEGLGTMAAFATGAFLVFFFLLIIPAFITAALISVATVGFAVFYVWHWVTRKTA
jgi:hypothetical protein